MDRKRRAFGLLGIALVIIGEWGAWVPHAGAALVLSGWDLAEFVKFLPGVSPIRELFYLPVWCAALVLALAAHRSGSPHDARFDAGASRLILTLIALALAAAILPPYPHVFDGFQPSEFRWRFLLGVTGSLFVLLAWFIKRWPQPLLGASCLILAVTGALPPVWQFLQIRHVIASVYGSALGWGWGLAPFLVGWTLVGVTGAWILLYHTRCTH